MKKLIIIPFLFLGCKAQKSSVEYKEIIKVDTFVREQIKTIYEPINDYIVIDNPCDSLGIIQKFSISKSIPNGKATIKSSNNKLVLSINTNKVLQTSTNQKEKSFNGIAQIKEKEVIKYRTPSWMIATILIESIIILLYLYFRFLMR